MAFTPPIIAVEAPTAIDTYAMIFILKVFYFSLIPSDMGSFFNDFILNLFCCFIIRITCDVAQTKFLEA
jgi:hypothetical protein